MNFMPLTNVSLARIYVFLVTITHFYNESTEVQTLGTLYTTMKNVFCLDLNNGLLWFTWSNLIGRACTCARAWSVGLARGRRRYYGVT